MIESVLIANRGEIAVRLIRAYRELGVRTIGVYSDADADALHVRLADEARRVGPAPVRDSYLNHRAIISAALGSAAQAIDPGYGLLSENAEFARGVAAAGLIFIGPPADVIAAMGDKTAARTAARRAGVPVVPGSPGAFTPGRTGADTAATVPGPAGGVVPGEVAAAGSGPESPAGAGEAGAAAPDKAGVPPEVLQVVQEVGFPLVVKASFGGGGRGMRIVADPGQLGSALAVAAAESAAAFGRPEVYLERQVRGARHVEVQILADGHGNVLHLGDRDCSVQRRHQKLIEEAPAPFLDDEVRQQMRAAAVRLAAEAGYRSTGTVEFLYEPSARAFFFMELNARLQVEHGVTELITGIDLVRERLAVAAGEALTIRQEDVRLDGVAIEARLTAEDPEQRFLPRPGTVSALHLPAGPWLRADFGVAAGDRVPAEYDSLIGKLMAWGPDRDTARQRLIAALAEFSLSGLPTTAAYLRDVLRQPAFIDGTYSTTSLEDHWLPAPVAMPDSQVGGAQHAGPGEGGQQAGPGEGAQQIEPVRGAGQAGWDRRAGQAGPGHDAEQVAPPERAPLPRSASPAAGAGRVVEVHTPQGLIRVAIRSGGGAGSAGAADAAAAGACDGSLPQTAPGSPAASGQPAAPMDGVVVKVEAEPGQVAQRHDVLAIVEAMKMQIPVTAPRAGEIRRVLVKPGESVTAGQQLAELA